MYGFLKNGCSEENSILGMLSGFFRFCTTEFFRLPNRMLSGMLCKPVSAPLLPRSKPAGKTLYTELAPADSGIEFVNPIDTEHPLKRLYTSAFGGGGVAAVAGAPAAASRIPARLG